MLSSAANASILRCVCYDMSLLRRHVAFATWQGCFSVYCETRAMFCNAAEMLLRVCRDYLIVTWPKRCQVSEKLCFLNHMREKFLQSAQINVIMTTSHKYSSCATKRLDLGQMAETYELVTKEMLFRSHGRDAPRATKEMLVWPYIWQEGFLVLKKNTISSTSKRCYLLVEKGTVHSAHVIHVAVNQLCSCHVFSALKSNATSAIFLQQPCNKS